MDVSRVRLHQVGEAPEMGQRELGQVRDVTGGGGAGLLPSRGVPCRAETNLERRERINSESSLILGLGMTY